MMWTYFYVVAFFNDDEKKIEEDCGFVMAPSLIEATKQISDWYGEKYIDSLRIEPIEDGDCPLTLEKIKDIFKKEAKING